MELLYRIVSGSQIWRDKQRQRDSETVRQRDRETERQRDRETERQRDKKKCILP
jgi:hypothetical protein